METVSQGDCRHHPGPTANAAAGALAVDPVCGMSVDPQTARHRSDYEGQPYYFCYK